MGATKYSGPECAIHKKAVDAVRKGNYRKTAGRLAGVDGHLFLSWLRKAEAEKEESVWWQLLQDVEAAEAEFEAECLAAIDKAGEMPKNWTARAWRLERMYPDRFGRNDRLQIEGRQEIHVLTPTAEQIPGILRALDQLGAPKADLELEEGTDFLEELDSDSGAEGL